MNSKKLSLVGGLFLICCALARNRPQPLPSSYVLRTQAEQACACHGARDPEPDATKMETDGKGQLAIDLTPGGYAVFVRAPGFKAGVTHIGLRIATQHSGKVASKHFPSSCRLGHWINPRYPLRHRKTI